MHVDLHTILERLLEELSFEASEIAPAHIEITPTYVDQKLGKYRKKQRFVTIYLIIEVEIVSLNCKNL